MKDDLFVAGAVLLVVVLLALFIWWAADNQPEPVPPTHTPTSTPVPPTQTPVPPTETPVPPTDTPAPTIPVTGGSNTIPSILAVAVLALGTGIALWFLAERTECKS